MLSQPHTPLLKAGQDLTFPAPAPVLLPRTAIDAPSVSGACVVLHSSRCSFVDVVAAAPAGEDQANAPIPADVPAGGGRPHRPRGEPREGNNGRPAARVDVSANALTYVNALNDDLEHALEELDRTLMNGGRGIMAGLPGHLPRPPLRPRPATGGLRHGGAAAGGARRPHNHKTVMCRYWERGYCRRGDSCWFAHGEAELRG